jgi:23S rRNA pseudouridine1911/1915/1917 synthase
MKPLGKDPHNMPQQPHLLFSDNHLLILSKPTGMLTQPNDTENPSLEAWGKDWVKERYQKPGNVFLHAVHRLDRPVSGIVVFARTSKALSRLNQSLRSGLFNKNYIAWVEGIMQKSEGVLEHFLKKEEYCSKVFDVNVPQTKKCLLKFNALKTTSKYTLLNIDLVTGRYHQIRAQLAAAGHPVVGDCKYGSSQPSEHLFLHHISLSFPHPVTQERLCFTAPLPDYWDYFCPSSCSERF